MNTELKFYHAAGERDAHVRRLEDLNSLLASDESVWFVTWGEATVGPIGFVDPPTRWQRLRRRVTAPFWRCRYALEDLGDTVAYRVRGAWRVLLGRAYWD